MQGKGVNYSNYHASVLLIGFESICAIIDFVFFRSFYLNKYVGYRIKKYNETATRFNY